MATTVTDPNAVQDPNALPLAKPKPVNQATSQQPVPGQAPQLALAAPSNIPKPTVAAPAQPVDRVALATQAYDTFAKAQEPAYQKSIEGVTSQAAGLGQLGSGQWRTALRDEANRHQLNLDTQRDTLLNKAVEGSIADASTAYQQALSGSQQGLAERLGTGQLEIARENADTSKTGTLGQLELAKSGQAQSGAQFDKSLDFQKQQAAIEAQFKAGTLTLAQKDQALRELANSQQYGLAGEQLNLAKTGQAASIDADKQRIALAQKEQEINAAYQNGQLTLAQKDQALRELANSQQFGLAGEQLALAKTGQAADIANQQGQLELAKAGQAQQAGQFDKSLAFQEEQAKIEAAFKSGQLTLAQKDQALRELANSQQNTIATGQLELAKSGQSQQADQFKQSLAEQAAGRLQQNSQFNASLAQSGEQFKASLAQNAQQFGLNQTQQMALAKLSDATANRSIDASTAQGKNALLLELARILGGPTGALNPDALAAIAKSFGVELPASTTTATTGITPTKKDDTTDTRVDQNRDGTGF